MGLVTLLVQTTFNGNKLLPGSVLEVSADVETRWFKNKIAEPFVKVSADVEEEIEEVENNEPISLEEMSIPELVKFAKENEINISEIPKADRKDQTKVLEFIQLALLEKEEVTE